MEVFGGVTQSTALLGGRMQALDRLQANLTATAGTAKSQADKIQDADAIELSMQLSRAQTLYEFTLASSAKLLQLSLLDYI